MTPISIEQWRIMVAHLKSLKAYIKEYSKGYWKLEKGSASIKSYEKLANMELYAFQLETFINKQGKILFPVPGDYFQNSPLPRYTPTVGSTNPLHPAIRRSHDKGSHNG